VVICLVLSELLGTILHANYYMTVMWHFTAKSHWRPYWEVSYRRKYFAGPVLPLWSHTVSHYSTQMLVLNSVEKQLDHWFYQVVSVIHFYSASAMLTMQTAVLARPFLSIHPSVCPSVMFLYCIQTNKDMIVWFSAFGRTILIVTEVIKVYPDICRESLIAGALK